MSTAFGVQPVQDTARVSLADALDAHIYVAIGARDEWLSHVVGNTLQRSLLQSFMSKIVVP